MSEALFACRRIFVRAGAFCFCLLIRAGFWCFVLLACLPFCYCCFVAVCLVFLLAYVIVCFVVVCCCFADSCLVQARLHFNLPAGFFVAFVLLALLVCFFVVVLQDPVCCSQASRCRYFFCFVCSTCLFQTETMRDCFGPFKGKQKRHVCRLVWIQSGMFQVRSAPSAVSYR